MRTFNFHQEILTSLEEINITTATEIQLKVIPHAMNGKDILASSHTGSGKTFSYLLPMISKHISIPLQTSHDGKAHRSKTPPSYLVLVPTRELAMQVKHNLLQITKKISYAVLIGGENIIRQSSQLRLKPQIIIGTPGRIIDYINRGDLDLSQVNTFILDETDKMLLDPGMKDQVNTIYSALPKKKQVLMFSATMPEQVISVSKHYLQLPERVSVGSHNKPADKIKQEVIKVTESEKFPELLKQLSNRQGSIIIFVKTKKSTEQLSKMLQIESHDARAIHGDLPQSKRDKVMQSFRSLRTRILVATDIAARGLDVSSIEHVINYDLPMCPEDYLHRIGRTGRAGNTGSAISFISNNSEQSKWRTISRLIDHGESPNQAEMFGRGARKPNTRGSYSNNSDSRSGPRPSYGNRSERGFGEKYYGSTEVVHRKPNVERNTDRPARPFSPDEGYRKRSDTNDRFGGGDKFGGDKFKSRGFKTFDKKKRSNSSY